jgi:hypothetical protein
MFQNILQVCAGVALLCCGQLHAIEPVHSRIDTLIAAGLPNYAQIAAGRSSDEEFIRRVTLDLTGRIPSAEAARSFFQDSSADKRAKLIAKLLESPEHARRMQEFFSVLLLDRRRDVKVPGDQWEDYLRKSFAAKKPLNQLVLELLSTDGADPKTRPAAKFLLERDLDPTQLTRDISRVFLGRDVQCAQCHDHPLIEDYKQEHFYGLQAFFNRAFLFPDAKSAAAVIAEKAEGEVSFTSVFDPKKVQRSTPPKVLDLKPIADAKLEKGKEYKVAPKKDVKPVPSYSRFANLGTNITAKDNRQFARTMVNRLWAMMLGRGLVHPLELDHSNNPASHPEVLDLLTEEFIAHNFSTNWLLQELALTKTYQLSSETTVKNTAIPEDRYARALLKPLSPEQLAFSLLQASGFTDSVRLSLAKNLSEEKVHAATAPSARAIVAIHGTRPGQPEEDFSSSLDQILFTKHNAAMLNLLSPRAGSLLDRLSKLKTTAAQVDELYLSIYSRKPSTDEQDAFQAILKNSTTAKSVLSDLIWAMLTATEFRFNH